MSLLDDEKKTEEREKLVRNEQSKLSATYLNGMAIALIAVGVLSPAISIHPASLKEAIFQGGIGFICVGISVALHVGARNILRDLR